MRTVKKYKCFFLFLFIVFVSITWYSTGNRRYIDPGVTAPISFLSNGDWWYSEPSIQKWTYGWDKYYILRKFGMAYNPSGVKNPTGYDFSHWQGVIDYFDDQLKLKGWIRGYRDCRNFLAVTEILPFEEENGYVAYQKEGDDNIESSPTICLFVWDLDNDGVPWFNVLLVSINPSFGTREFFIIKNTY